jgi:hypothetical protein
MMVADKTFVFLLHRPVADLEQTQLDRLERKVDRLTTAMDILSGRMALLLKALDEDDGDPSEHPALTLDGQPAGQERDQTKGLG